MLELTDTDRHIVESIVGLLDGAGGLVRVRRLQSASMSFDRDMWAQLASLGWLGASVPETIGGTELAFGEIALLLEHAGKRLMPEPLVLALGGARLLARCRAEPAAELRTKVIDGEAVCVPVTAEPSANGRLFFDAEGVTHLSARTAYISDGHVGDAFLVPVKAKGDLRICVVQRSGPGIAVESEATVDGGSITRLHFDRVALTDLPVMEMGPDAVAAFDEATDLMRLGYTALLTGLMDEALAMTVAYLKDRRQFGVPIGSFQALQHRVASLYVIVKASRAFLYEACKADAERRGVAALGAKAYASQSAMQTVRECVQLHGAMGYTEEHNMSLFFRRAMSLAVAGGDAIFCRKLLYVQRRKIRDN